ncbi:MAG: ribonuclease III [Candidatus Portnoybacteria bacterium RIFCSPLOWO2_12_FULL_39_9]|uniref:Ribonuclease 3 n=1 Tax=Candidatus Portnoybacteria bacterium RIFCSPHIGHO2_12_FULL_38_9 TaxID=1801997 RepID=A0A1G2FGF6_9BACT|nr:MAG: ribonuclease III [Candidatus Portnoybacteria bacterium RBG_13_40_8]OGZ36041.1 MAG: ribonuclease III [Candidatus Portnoybacteria bacterium RIFCSPHIGHO2_02_FULL_39_12]OGZ36730.1 MAG: ribonuclease III [Candidatus Portnoybacteria bacterium RIFCSPHIGHO2_12_FULL_38_9]OGZ38089.1 MAG: ribonuclease III [Candidatus Portnoybacteria bacterium RIFCSPLOWO2_01_FULL_38_39]OGZ40096.1 MAG: ribonuclease III [Candidatus Portnoybacteria bacterium RIFCSPLOWO2_12_FULL_39_9]
MDLSSLEQKLKIKFNNPDLLQQALVHRSYINENPDFHLDQNERLEFLGDAVLELVVTENLYRNYPNPEGELTNWRAALVNAKMLAEIANRLEIDNYLLLSKGEAKDTGRARQYILANALEAMIGAMYLDQGYEITSQFIEREILKELPRILENQLYRDPKSRFQEMAQDRVGITPIYKVLKEQGPDHAKHFTVGVFLDKELVASGEGVSKQEAQEKAAQAGLKEREWG